MNMGVPDSIDDWRDIDWLPGGCILHRRENLIVKNYYPFSGKAYAEDLFHSLLLKEKGVILVRSGKAICDLDFTSSSYQGIVKQIELYIDYCRAMRKLIRSSQRSRFRFYLFILTYNLYLLIRRIKRLYFDHGSK